jgi:acetaldehyde dehydrogenase (acetylating)
VRSKPAVFWSTHLRFKDVIGIGTALTPSFTLGCGTLGGNSTTDNVNYIHLLNIKRLALKL